MRGFWDLKRYEEAVAVAGRAIDYSDDAVLKLTNN